MAEDKHLRKTTRHYTTASSLDEKNSLHAQTVLFLMAMAMASLGQKSLLLLVQIGLIVQVASGGLGRFCGDRGGFDDGAATVCCVDYLDGCKQRMLTGDVLIVGNGSSSTWDVRASPLSFAPDARVTVSCLRILLDENPLPGTAQQLSVDVTGLLSPPFLQSPFGQLPALTIRDVVLPLDCDVLLEWQRYLCGIRLHGKTLVQGNIISILSWTDGYTTLEHVNLTCDPGFQDFSPACSMAVVEEVADILEASSRLQDPNLPLVLTVSEGLSFTESVWPEDGLRITANVTLSATLGSIVTISFGLRTVLFTVDSKSSSTAFLSFRGCILLDLPLSYLPLDHPRRPFGILSTGLWPVYREEVAMGLYNCTLILNQEEFQFWSFWLSILVSPIPSVRALGNWTFASGVQLDPSGDDYIQLASYLGRYTTLVNVRYQISNDVYATQQRKNILQITNEPSVPPTVVFQTRNSEDLISALMSTPVSPAAEHGQYIILTGNLTMVNESMWPATGAPIRFPTTITTWPSSWVAFDLKMMRGAFLIMQSPSASVVIKNVVLLNLATGTPGSDTAGLTTGLWAFNYSNWRTSDQQRIALERAFMVVSREEVEYYIRTTVTRKQTDSWVSSFQVDSYDEVNHSWVQFTALATSRFTAQALNITDTVPDMFDSNMINVTTGSGWSGAWSDPATGGTSKNEVLLFAALAITLPSTLGAALATYLFLKRRRLAQLCQTQCAKHAKCAKNGGDGEDEYSDAEEDEESRKMEPSCCFSLPLRKSKFVNPLYAEAGRPPPDIVLTGVLGPAALARSLVPAEASAVLATGVPVPAAADVSMVSPGAQNETPAETDWGQGSAQGAATAGVQASGAGRGLCIFSAAAAELRQGRASIDGLTVAAADSGVSSLSESCVGSHGLEPRVGSNCSSRAPHAATATAAAAAAAAAAHALAAACSAAAGAPYGHREAVEEAPSLEPGKPQDASASATGPNGAFGAMAAAEDASAQRRLLLARQESGWEASQAGRPIGNPRFLDVQHLDRLRREIGDRHLEVQHSLGWGGCGVVYKGVWKGLQVAVKTILLQGDSRQSQQFLTEAAISASLQHANIVTTYLYELRPLDEVDPGGAGSTEIRIQSRSSDGAPDAERMSCWKLYIVQEYCELGTLKAAIDQGYFKGASGGPPNLGFLLTIALDIALGLAHVHSKNVVHGDITVSNILLQACPARPQGCIAKVADFGLSVKFEPGQSQGYHMYGGTPHYMAPERVRGVLSKQSDTYSLGVCLWELYCGTPPWRRSPAGAHHLGCGSFGSADSGNQQHNSFGEPVLGGSGGSDTFRFPRSCPQDYSSLVFSCLSVEPQTRPTVSAVAATLQRLYRRYA